MVLAPLHAVLLSPPHPHPSPVWPPRLYPLSCKDGAEVNLSSRYDSQLAEKNVVGLKTLESESVVAHGVRL